MNILYYLIIFLIYSYFGAHFEHLSYADGNKKKAMVNPIITGFPLYGSCALFIILINNYFPLKNHLLEIIFYGGLFTLVELTIGLILGAGKDSYTKEGLVYLWDYSDDFLNYKGIISLRHFILWGVMSLAVIKINPYISNFVTKGLS